MSDRTLGQYLDGEVPPGVADRVREHLVACETCRRRLEQLRGLDEAIRRGVPPSTDAPDLAPALQADLRRRGAFFKARIRSGKRRLFGERIFSGRMVAAVAVAASIVVLATIGMDHATRNEWARRTDPVLADAERVLVRLVYVEPPEKSRRLAWARDESKKLGLSQRLAQARTGAEPTWDQDLATLETTFQLLARQQPLPPRLVAELGDGQLLARASRLRERLSTGG